MKNIFEFSLSETLQKSGQEMAKESTEHKTNGGGLAKWKERVSKHTLAYYGHGNGGDKVVRIQVNGKRRCVQLLTADLKEAAQRARQFFYDVKSKGWAE